MKNLRKSARTDACHNRRQTRGNGHSDHAKMRTHLERAFKINEYGEILMQWVLIPDQRPTRCGTYKPTRPKQARRIKHSRKTTDISVAVLYGKNRQRQNQRQ